MPAPFEAFSSLVEARSQGGCEVRGFTLRLIRLFSLKFCAYSTVNCYALPLQSSEGGILLTCYFPQAIILRMACYLTPSHVSL